VLNLSQNGCSVWVTSSTELALTPTAVALGKFDGVHRGHQRVIQPVLHVDGQMSAINDNQQLINKSNKEYTYSTVVTFNPHPQEFFTGQPRALLTPVDEKVQQLRSLGVKQLVLLPFDKELSALTPEEFVKKILVQQLQCQRISIGADFRFGSQRSGTAKDLQLIAAKYHIPVAIVPLQTHAGEFSTDNSVNLASTEELPISTSLIRQNLESGDIEVANQLLGRPYTLIGEVVKGQQLGRTIGFPTANLQLPKDKFVPRYGVYAVRIYAENTALGSGNILCLGVMNIGDRPTVNGTQTTVEVHLFDWAGDLYGKKVSVQLVKYLRQQQKFPSLDALKTQIQLDCIAAKLVLSAE
jgi:riboflavin kinase / FMN adenylyltransferase